MYDGNDRVLGTGLTDLGLGGSVPIRDIENDREKGIVREMGKFCFVMFFYVIFKFQINMISENTHQLTDIASVNGPEAVNVEEIQIITEMTGKRTY